MNSAGCTSCSRPSHMCTNSCRSMYVLPLAKALHALMAGCSPELCAAASRRTRLPTAREAVSRTMATGSRHSEKVSGISVDAVVSVEKSWKKAGSCRAHWCRQRQSCFCFCTLHSVSTYCSRRSAGRQRSSSEKLLMTPPFTSFTSRRKPSSTGTMCCTLSCGPSTCPSSCRLQASVCRTGALLSLTSCWKHGSSSSQCCGPMVSSTAGRLKAQWKLTSASTTEEDMDGMPVYSCSSSRLTSSCPRQCRNGPRISNAPLRTQREF